jgi:hypothetical protein
MIGSTTGPAGAAISPSRTMPPTQMPIASIGQGARESRASIAPTLIPSAVPAGTRGAREWDAAGGLTRRRTQDGIVLDAITDTIQR